MAKYFRCSNCIFIDTNKSKKRQYKFDNWNVGPSKKESKLRVLDIIKKIKKFNKNFRFSKKS